MAIDFTASNGDPDQRGTLHYLDPSGHEQNQYEQCMSCIGSVLQQYDTDKRFQVRLPLMRSTVSMLSPIDCHFARYMASVPAPAARIMTSCL